MPRQPVSQHRRNRALTKIHRIRLSRPSWPPAQPARSIRIRPIRESGGLCEVAGARIERCEWRPHISRIERRRGPASCYGESALRSALSCRALPCGSGGRRATEVKQVACDFASGVAERTKADPLGLVAVAGRARHRIRHYGFLAKGDRGFNLARFRDLLEPQTGQDRGDTAAPPADGEPKADTPHHPFAVCPECGGLMRCIGRTPARQADVFHCDTS
jgi:hypothetical protein